jgi:hypothetical protein
MGWNDVEWELYSPAAGGGRGGLRAYRVNRNPGAESTLAVLLPLAEQWAGESTGGTMKGV